MKDLLACHYQNHISISILKSRFFFKFPVIGVIIGVEQSRQGLYDGLRCRKQQSSKYFGEGSVVEHNAWKTGNEIYFEISNEITNTVDHSPF